MSTSGISTPASSAPFETQARQTILHLRTALGAIMEALPGEIRRPHELQKALGIDKSLASKVVRLVHAKDPFRVGRHVPGPAAMRILLNAARRRVDHALIQAAARAGEEFEQLVEVHAGDRASLAMMLAGHATAGTEQADLAHRKAAFQGMSYIWGVQADAQLKADFLHPSAGKRGILDIASLRGFVGLRRLRPDVPWVIGRSLTSDDDGVVRSPTRVEPLAPPPGGEGSAPVLARFCSEPLPQLRRGQAHGGFVDDELVEGPVGKTGALTCITGDVTRNVGSYYRDEHNRWGTVNARMYTPCEVLVFDQFVHEDMFGPISPELCVYSDLSGRMWIPAVSRPRDRLPFNGNVEHLGKGPSLVYTPHVPRYVEMVQYVLEKLGWAAERFDVYRVVIEYPVIPSTVAMTHELPEAPG